eukprot:gene19774-25388_t
MRKGSCGRAVTKKKPPCRGLADKLDLLSDPLKVGIMSILGNLVWVAFAFIFGQAFFNIYQLVSPAECKEEPCIAPLFQEDQLVDRTPTTGKAFEELTPLWNATELNSTADVKVDVNVTLPSSVRQNGTLFAHIYLVRSGLSPNPKDHRKRKYPRDQAWYHSTPDLVVTSTALTRHMSPIARNASSLLTSDNSTAAANAAESDPEVEKKEQNVQPFLASVFLWSITSLMQPSIFSAVVR